MQYDMQKLGRMTLEQLTEIAHSFGLKVGRNASLQSVIYDILDAQADKRGAEVQAKEDAKQAKGEEKKRNKRARIQSSPTKVNTENMKSNRVLATVGNEQETLEQMKEEQAKQPAPKPVISGVQPGLFDIQEGEKTPAEAAKQEKEEKPAKKVKNRKEKNNTEAANEVKNEEVVPDSEAVSEAEKPAKKKKGRKKKNSDGAASNNETVNSGEVENNSEAAKEDGAENKEEEAVKGEAASKPTETKEEKQARLNARIAQITKQIAKREEQIANGEDITPIPANNAPLKPEDEVL